MKDKQIEEMARDLCKHSLTEYCASGRCQNPNCLVNAKALETLCAKGYRKASDFAWEIDDLKRYIILNEDIALKCKEENGEQNHEYWKGELSAFKQIRAYIDAELKKKYFGEATNGTTKTEET
jgi:hypothetical protein